MAYIAGGEVRKSKPLWRVSTVSEMFWAILNYIGMFFTTMFSLEASEAYGRSRSSRQSGPGGGGRPGGWGPGGGGSGGGRPAPGYPPPRGGLNNVRGLDNYPPAPSCGGGSCSGGLCG